MSKSKIFASFIVCPVANGKIAATTRPLDKGEGMKIGLPGGKLEDGETSAQAAMRESYEEGWHISLVAKEPFFIYDIENGLTIAWHLGQFASQLEIYKERHRISPVEATLEQVIQSGFGNDKAMEAYANSLTNVAEWVRNI